MDKIWFICFDDKEEGPFSAKELSSDSRVTLDTLVWREGFPDWVPLRNIKELRKYFIKPRKEEKKELFSKKLPPQEEIAIEHGKDPNFYFFWLIIAVIILLYLFYKMYRFQ